MQSQLGQLGIVQGLTDEGISSFIQFLEGCPLEGMEVQQARELLAPQWVPGTISHIRKHSAENTVSKKERGKVEQVERVKSLHSKKFH